MKKVLFLAILILNSQFLILNSLHAQGFEWVRTYTGAEVTSGVTTNQLIGSCVDSAGNLYILGEFSPQAQLCGTNLLPFEVIETSRPRWQGVVIAKISPSGELLCGRALKAPASEAEQPETPQVQGPYVWRRGCCRALCGRVTSSDPLR